MFRTSLPRLDQGFFVDLDESQEDGPPETQAAVIVHECEGLPETQEMPAMQMPVQKPEELPETLEYQGDGQEEMPETQVLQEVVANVLSDSDDATTEPREARLLLLLKALLKHYNV
jgi:hypothetical protein